MLLEDYFDFLSQNEIRLKGHRIGIEDVLYEHIISFQSGLWISLEVMPKILTQARG